MALSQMLLFELKGRGTQDLALPLQSSDKFARKWKRLEPESRLAGYKYRSDIIVGISQVPPLHKWLLPDRPVNVGPGRRLGGHTKVLSVAPRSGLSPLGWL